MTSPARPPFGIALLVAGALLMTAACGSTVQPSGDALLGAGQGGAVQQGLAPGGTDGLGTTQPGTSADGMVTSGSGSSGGGTVTGPGTTSGSAGGAGTSGPSTSGGTTGGTSTAAGSAGGKPVLEGPGVSATEIRLGIPYCGDCAQANAALGAGGEDPGDTQLYYKAVIDEVNARGGVLGRKLVPVFKEMSASQNIDAASQAMCEAFTKDDKVLIIFMQGEIVYECAKKAGSLVNGAGGSGPVFERYPNMFAPATIRLERLGAVTVKAMVKAGWHKPEPKWPTGKIGLITWDNNDYRYSMEKGWLAALRGAGLKETDVRYVAVPQSDKSLADASAAISSAVLAFRDQDIDHVFIADGPAGIFTGVGLTLMFLNTAKSQGYYPRYGFNTNNSPGWENLPADQQSGMLAVDSFDTERINDEGIALNPQRERCWKLITSKGLKATDAQPTGNTAIAACEAIWFTEALVNRAAGATTLPQLIVAGESLGSSYRSPYTYGTRLAKGQHDGVALFRNSRFDDGCACMKYSSEPYEP